MAPDTAAKRVGSTEAIMRVRRLCADHQAFRGVEIDGDSLVVVVAERNPDPHVDEWELVDGRTSGGWPVRVEVRDGNLDLPFGGRDAEGVIMENEGGRHVLGAS